MRNHACSNETRRYSSPCSWILVFVGFLFTGSPSPANAIEIQKLPVPKQPSTGAVVQPTFRPDLTVSYLSNPPASSPPGNAFRVTATTYNIIGSATAPAGTITRIYLSRTLTLGDGDDILLRPHLLDHARQLVDVALPGGASHTDNWIVIVPETTPVGISYHMAACADNDGRVQEANEANNCRFATTMVAVGWADLTVVRISEPNWLLAF
jgi:hypothetical protein